jgi:V8-like Glu-specific endopeptidase
MNAQSPVATDVSQLFDDLGQLAERVRVRADEALESNESADGASAASPGRQVGSAARAAQAEALLDGAQGLEKLAETPDADLTPAESFGVEAIILLVARPALLVQSGDFPGSGALPPEWAHLDDHRASIRDSIARVGRIEVTGHPDLDWVGTGFLVADDVVMTNRHVAVEFARHDGTAFTFLSGRTSRLDLLEEAGNAMEMPFSVSEVIGIHDAEDVDLALLRVQPTGDDGITGLPSPLEVTSAEPDDVIGRPVYVVGYPAWDGRRNEPEPMRRIFMDVYNVKRLQPGTATQAAAPTAIGHDCSTLGGNSGSPVFDLETHRVIALHYGGRYRMGNVAVPLWQLVGDPLLEAAGVNFAD